MRSTRRTWLSCALATAVALSPALGAAEKGRPETAGSAATAVAAVAIDNFGRINPTYYRGAQPEGRDYADLAALGVKTVIDLQRDGSAAEAQLVEGAGMRFFRIPMTTHEPPTAEQIGAFLRLVNDPANQPVYVHCAGGRHRTGVMTAVYRMTREGWTADQAFSEMKRFKFGADFLHPEFKQFVYGYRAEAVPAADVQVAAATAHPLVGTPAATQEAAITAAGLP